MAMMVMIGGSWIRHKHQATATVRSKDLGFQGILYIDCLITIYLQACMQNRNTLDRMQVTPHLFRGLHVVNDDGDLWADVSDNLSHRSVVPNVQINGLRIVGRHFHRCCRFGGASSSSLSRLCRWRPWFRSRDYVP